MDLRSNFRDVRKLLIAGIGQKKKIVLMVHQMMIHQMKDKQNGGDFVDVVEVPSGKRILKRKGIL